MTRQGSFKRIVRRRAKETGQRYTEARSDLEGLDSRVFHKTTGERVVAHLVGHYGIDAVGATKAGLHSELVFRIDQRDAEPWIARVFPPARSNARVEDDAAILRFLARSEFPAERLAVDDAVSEFDGQRVLVTRCVHGGEAPTGSEVFAMQGDLLGRMHALTLDESVGRAGGAFGHDPAREGSPRQDLIAALSFLDAIDAQVAAPHRERFDRLREQVRSADDGHDLPEALLHSDLGDHIVFGERGPVVVHWQAAGRGPRLAELSYLLWTTGGDPATIAAAVGAYRRHVDLSEVERDRLATVLFVRPLYLVCWYYWQSLSTGYQPSGAEGWWGYINPEYLDAVAGTAQAAFGR